MGQMTDKSDWSDGNYMEWADQERLVRQDLEELEKIWEEARGMKKSIESIGGLTDFAFESCGYDKEKIIQAVESCVDSMSQLTIAESKVARRHLDSVMENMYKRSPDTLIGTILPHQ